MTALDHAARQSPFAFTDIADYFRRFAARYRREGSPFLAALSERCADDAELMALVTETPPGQPYELLFFGAVHSILLGDPDDPFAPYFGVGAKSPVADDATFAGLKDFCRRRREEILAILKNRTVQVTRARRAAFLIPLFGHILRKGAQEPFSLVEIGSSAGLLTIFDSYSFDFGPLGRVGDPANPQVGVPTFEGREPPLPDHMPQIAERFGVDLNPVDPSDPTERRWIQGLAAPDAVEERLEMSRALEVRARVPLETIRGDAMQVVPELLPRLGRTVCVVHAFCMYQWPAAAQAQFHDMLLEASRTRTIYRLGVDFLHDTPGRPGPAKLDPSVQLSTDMIAVTYRNGEAEWEYLGLADGLGRRVKWMA